MTGCGNWNRKWCSRKGAPSGVVREWRRFAESAVRHWNPEGGEIQELPEKQLQLIARAPSDPHRHDILKSDAARRCT
jgi:hypothetical protein